ncbi:MAG TPA: LysM peptidoglycan-binding domain-containing protein [bacterium]|nr:LysM peptidoglycan-binding domain-containing protein [bacterium]
MTTFKSLIWGAALLAGAIFLSAPARADVNFSITGEGQLSRHFDGTNTGFAHNGWGGTVLFELEPVDFLSVGGEFGYTSYFGLTATGEGASTLDAVARLMPFSGTFSPYLLGSYGINPFGTAHPRLWPNQKHFSAGLGFRYFVLPQWALDFGGTYEFFDPTTAPLQAVNLHAGVAFFVQSPFKNSDKMIWAGGGVTVMQPVTITETDQEVQSIQDIAQNEYGDRSLYPAIIDANFKDKSKPLILPPGMQLIIPQHLTDQMVADAHLKAKTPEYKNAADTFQIPQIENVQYRLEPAESDDSSIGGAKDSLTFQSDSLWDIAARPDVYGDPELYPLLVDANFSRLSDPLILKPGTKLVIPQGVSKAKMQRARINAWTAEYMRWRGAQVSHEEYREWRKEKGLPPIDEVTGEVIQPGSLGN